MGRFKPYKTGLTYACTALFVLAVLLPTQASATRDTGGYPFAGLECVHVPYNNTGPCKNFDWGLVRGDASGGNIYSPYGYGYRNCTDYVAWRLRMAGVPDTKVRGLGNARTWAARARARGLVVDTTPTVGSVATNSTVGLGHVAYVAAVQGQTITIQHYNGHKTGEYGVDVGTPASLGLTEFIHFDQQVLAARASRRDDVVLVAPAATGSGRLEAHVLDAESGYTTWAHHHITAAPYVPPGTRYAMGDANGDGAADLALFKAGVAGNIEVAVLDGATYFKAWIGIFDTPAQMPTDNTTLVMGDINADGRSDLVLVTDRATGSGYVEVHALDGATNYTTWLMHQATSALPPAGTVQYLMGDITGDERADLVMAANDPTGSGRVEAHILDAASGFHTKFASWATASAYTAPSTRYTLGDVDGDGYADLVLMGTGPTPSGKIEVYALSAKQNYSTWIGNWVTPADYATDTTQLLIGN